MPLLFLHVQVFVMYHFLEATCPLSSCCCRNDTESYSRHGNRHTTHIWTR